MCALVPADTPHALPSFENFNKPEICVFRKILFFLSFALVEGRMIKSFRMSSNVSEAVVIPIFIAMPAFSNDPSCVRRKISIAKIFSVPTAGTCSVFLSKKEDEYGT